MRGRHSAGGLFQTAVRPEPTRATSARPRGAVVVRVLKTLGCGIILAIAAAATITYRLEPSKPLARFSADQIALLAKLNRADPAHLPRLPRIIVPDRWDQDELLYSPMPHVLQHLSLEGKAIIVDLPSQVFGAYKCGTLVRWGPVSSGRRSRQTPPGMYHLNWRARVHVSTEDPTWIMHWYFNFSNVQGLALHQYSMPGRPASHGCVRLLAVDAMWIYDWGEACAIDPATNDAIRPGTLVLVIGRYNYAASQPWLRPEWWTEGVCLPFR
jgi:hypothetical protein